MGWVVHWGGQVMERAAEAKWRRLRQVLRQQSKDASGEEDNHATRGRDTSTPAEGPCSATWNSSPPLSRLEPLSSRACMRRQGGVCQAPVPVPPD